MKFELGQTIARQREVSEMTQDQFGAKFSVSGPAVFKFEKGYVKPSLRLWLKMAEAFEIDQRKAVLMWAKAKLPEEYQDFVDLATPPPRAKGADKKGKARASLSRLTNRDSLQKAVSKDRSLPKALRDMLAEEEIWAVYKPTGQEIETLRDTFGALGKGNKTSYREALRLIREFSQNA